jgi:oligoendopeptidase F
MEAELSSLAPDIQALAGYRGRLHEGPALVADAVECLAALYTRVGRIFVYASMCNAVDTADQAATRRLGMAQAVFGQLVAAAAFVDPELIAIGQTTVDKWIATEPRLTVLAQYSHNLFRQQAHVRSTEVEEVLGLLLDPFASTEDVAGAMADADFKFPSAVASDGSKLELTQGTLDKYLARGDREARRTAWENYMDTYLAHKNSLAANLTQYLKQNVFLMRVRRHESTLAASLFDDNLPAAVFHNLLDTFKKNLPTWHKYWRVRRRALGVDTLHPYDIWAPLARSKPVIAYPQAVDWISAGLAPLGDDYVSVLRAGCLQDRWVDIYPNHGKRQGAFSSGVKGTLPFILMSYVDDIGSLSTLAHELGHSLHSYFTWQAQPFVYARYSIFLAEIASNFNQAMTRGYLLQNNPDTNFQISVLEEAMDNFHRYFFIMPTLARFELELYRRLEQGKGLSADDMIDLMADLFAEAYGSEMHVDRERVGITWATFLHLYMNYYVFRYATGISGANAFARRILDGESGVAEKYLGFLKAGSSAYALDILRRAGLDLSTPEPVEAAFSVLAGYVDRLEKLTGP